MSETVVTTRRLIVGCGYLGLRVGQIWRAQGDPVFALTRKQQRFQWFRENGWLPLLGDLCGDLPDWPLVDTALLAVGFDRQAEHSIEDVYVRGVERLIKSLPDSISRLIYISSTGVYGAGSGESIDEQSPCQPDRPGGAACLAAEQLLRASRFADRTVILRFAGIYGPDRVPRLASIADGSAIAADPYGYLNLIHVEDGASLVAAVAQSPIAPTLYNVSDNQPCRRGEFLTLAAELLGLPAPVFDAEASSANERRGSDKRINADKLYREVPLALRYPSYREGLRDAIAPADDM